MLSRTITATKASTPSSIRPRVPRIRRRRTPRKVGLFRLSKVTVAPAASQQGRRYCQHCFTSAAIACAWDDGQVREDIPTQCCCYWRCTRRPLLVLLPLPMPGAEADAAGDTQANGTRKGVILRARHTPEVWKNRNPRRMWGPQRRKRSTGGTDSRGLRPWRHATGRGRYHSGLGCGPNAVTRFDCGGSSGCRRGRSTLLHVRETRNPPSPRQKLRLHGSTSRRPRREAMTEPEARLDEVRLRHQPIGDELEDVVKMLQGGPFLSFLTAYTTFLLSTFPFISFTHVS
jgi:hypothetical protein